MSIWQGSLWKGSLWQGSIWKGGLWGVGGINLNPYNFYVDFKLNVVPKDLVSKQGLTTTLTAGRRSYAGADFGTDEPVIEGDGSLLINGAYVQLVPYSEDTSNWTGSGPWTQVLTISATGTYILSTNLNGATVTITAGTATIDAGASATFGNPDQFVVTGIGTVTISTDTADPKAQITLSPYVLPYAVNSTAGTLSVPLNYADATHGVKAEEIQANFPQLLDALDGIADGVELIVDGTFAAVCGVNWTCGTGWTIGGGVATHAGSSGALHQTIGTAVDRFKVTYTITGRTSGGVTIGDNNGTLGTTRTTNGTYTETVSNTTAVAFVAFFAQTGFDGSISNVSVQVMDDAQGRITIPITPKFDAADVSGVVNILTANDEEASFLFYNGATQEIHAYDGTNTAVVAYVPVNGTQTNMFLDYGDDGGQKMRLTVDATVGAQATNAGSFPVTADDLSIGWITDEPFQIDSIIIEKEPTW